MKDDKVLSFSEFYGEPEPPMEHSMDAAEYLQATVPDDRDYRGIPEYEEARHLQNQRHKMSRLAEMLAISTLLNLILFALVVIMICFNYG